MVRAGRSPAEVNELGRERGHLRGVRLDLGHSAVDSEHGIVVSAGGWTVGYDGSVDAWTVR